MPIAKWEPATLYLTDSLVVPTTVAGATATVIPNADFEGGDVSWTKGTGWAINSTLPFAGSNSAEYSGPGVAVLESDTKHVVAPGKSITASCFINQGVSADGDPNAAVILRWYTDADAFISQSTGNLISTGAEWRQSVISAVAPPTAGKVAIGCTAVNNNQPMYVDNFQWNYVTGTAAPTLAFKAIQLTVGTSGTTEPTWPTMVGNTVVDNTVTWEAVTIDSVTWEASSVLTSGGTEPIWPTEPGSFIADNNIAWMISHLRIEDENNPNSKVVAIAASKVFAGDTDIVRFCATLNARDWTSEDDAGFLPTGLQQKSQVGVDAMGVYRGNLCVWSASTFQIWQVDPDPAAMALIDAMEGIGTRHQQAVQPVSDDLFFLAALGVRTVTIAEGTNNLATGDVGVPIDILVQVEANAIDSEPVASYYPGAGQYWLAFRPISMAAVLLAGQFLITSPIYPIEVTDAVQNNTAPVRGRLLGIGVEEAIINDTEPARAFLVDVLVETEYEDAIINDTAPSFGSLGGTLIVLDTPCDAVINDTAPSFGLLDGALIVYENFEDAIINDTEPQDSTLV